MSTRRPSGPGAWWDRIMASRHRRSILGSLAVLVLLVVVLVSGLLGGGNGAGRGDSLAPPPTAVPGVSHAADDLLCCRLRH